MSRFEGVLTLEPETGAADVVVVGMEEKFWLEDRAAADAAAVAVAVAVAGEGDCFGVGALVDGAAAVAGEGTEVALHKLHCVESHNFVKCDASPQVKKCYSSQKHKELDDNRVLETFGYASLCQ